jgi:hypothetical protein
MNVKKIKCPFCKRPIIFKKVIQKECLKCSYFQIKKQIGYCYWDKDNPERIDLVIDLIKKCDNWKVV